LEVDADSHEVGPKEKKLGNQIFTDIAFFKNTIVTILGT
jgi:hypothetical protein